MNPRVALCMREASRPDDCTRVVCLLFVYNMCLVDWSEPWVVKACVHFHIWSHVEAPPASSEPPRVLYALDVCECCPLFLSCSDACEGWGTTRIYTECAYGARV
jgi:hypothetical protein